MPVSGHTYGHMKLVMIDCLLGYRESLWLRELFFVVLDGMWECGGIENTCCDAVRDELRFPENGGYHSFLTEQ